PSATGRRGVVDPPGHECTLRAATAGGRHRRGSGESGNLAPDAQHGDGYQLLTIEGTVDAHVIAAGVERVREPSGIAAVQGEFESLGHDPTGVRRPWSAEYLQAQTGGRLRAGRALRG